MQSNRTTKEKETKRRRSSKMEGEIKSFIKVWTASIASMCYCYFIVRHLPRGITRFLSLVPIFYVFIVLPYNLHSFHLGCPTSLYLVWLANFKLLLFAFDQGPLVDLNSIHPSKSLLRFISTALLPIKMKKNPPPKSYQKSQNPNKTLDEFSNAALMAVKVVLLGMVISLYDYREHWHHYFIMGLYILHIYLGIELVLAMSGAMARAIPGVEIEPQFDEPYLATSLQDFWGRRWNLMVTSILRPAVYDPVRRISAHIFGRRKWASLPAMGATFLVSGLMHEVIYFYLTRASPTWEVTWFFVLQGMCTVAEVMAKKAVAGRWRLHRLISGPLTIGFVAVTACWLLFAQALRNGVDQKVIRESSILLDYVKGSFVQDSRLLLARLNL